MHGWRNSATHALPFPLTHPTYTDTYTDTPHTHPHAPHLHRHAPHTYTDACITYHVDDLLFSRFVVMLGECTLDSVKVSRCQGINAVFGIRCFLQKHSIAAGASSVKASRCLPARPTLVRPMKLKTPEQVVMTAARAAAGAVRMIPAETSLAVAVAEVVAATLVRGVEEVPGLYVHVILTCQGVKVLLTFLGMSM